MGLGNVRKNQDWRQREGSARKFENHLLPIFGEPAIAMKNRRLAKNSPSPVFASHSEFLGIEIVERGRLIVIEFILKLEPKE
jgi:hypothetical protein